MTVARNLYAAVEWLRAQRVAGTTTPRYIVLPRLSPYAALWQRYARLLDGPPLRMAWACQVPLAGTCADVRLRALNRVLRENGLAQAVAQLLPYLRRGPGDSARRWEAAFPRTTPRRALAHLLATGAHDSPQGPNRWGGRVASLVERSVRQAAQATGQRDPAYVRTGTAHKQQAERVVRELRPLVPALQALDRLLERFAAGGPPAELLAAYCDFARKWLLLPLADSEWNSLVASLEQWGRKQGDWLAGRACATDLDAALEQVLLQPQPCDGAEVIVTLDPPPSPQVPVCFLQPGIDESLYLARSVASSAHRAVDPYDHAMCTGGESDLFGKLVGGNKKPPWPGASGPPWGLKVDPSGLPLWGLAAPRPLSATALPALLTCPYRFLLERIAHVHPLSEMATPGRLDQTVFGAIVHAAIAGCLRAFGAEFAARKRDVEYWCARARVFAAEALEMAKTSYPLWGEEVQSSACHRVTGAVEALIRDEWRQPACDFVAVEHRFGEPQGVALSLPRGAIFVRGEVDWLVRPEPGELVVRELKTGEAGLQSRRFFFRALLQLGVYGMALQSGQSGIAGRVVAAELIRIAPAGVQRRVVAGAALETLYRDTQAALQLGHDLLRSGCFPRTPDEADCARCPFLVHCGEEAALLAARALPEASEDAAREFFLWRVQNSRQWSDEPAGGARDGIGPIR